VTVGKGGDDDVPGTRGTILQQLQHGDAVRATMASISAEPESDGVRLLLA
jgi:hypothetical protein